MLRNSRCGIMPFHNAQHTLEVYRNVKTICTAQGLDKDYVEPLLLAALFHDIGNSIQFIEHESISASLAILFLEKQGYPDRKVSKVVRFIKATRLPHQPGNFGEKIIVDADLFHLGTSRFWERNKLLREELQEFRGISYTDLEWNLENLKFLKSHKYYTIYGRSILDPVKQINIKKLKRANADFNNFEN